VHEVFQMMIRLSSISRSAVIPRFAHLVLYTPDHPGVKAGKAPARYVVSVSSYVHNTPGRISLDEKMIVEEHPVLIKLERDLKRVGEEYLNALDKTRAGQTGDFREVDSKFCQKVYDLVKKPLQRILIDLSGTISDADRRSLLQVVRRPNESRATLPVLACLVAFTSCEFSNKVNHMA
jgi:hypothetical protein